MGTSTWPRWGGGRLGVAVTDALRERGFIEGPDGTPNLGAVRGDRIAGRVSDEADYSITTQGHRDLSAMGLVLPPALGAVRCCIDWNEQRHHRSEERRVGKECRSRATADG